MTEITVHHGDDALRNVARRSAEASGTLPRAVELQLLLHLPRLASASGLVSASKARSEADRLAHRLPLLPDWEVNPPSALYELSFVEVHDAVARTIDERFHYLGSHRRGRAHGLKSPTGQIVALAVTTACDVDRLRERSLTAFGDPQPRVLARVFAFEGAPRNSLTRLFKLVASAEAAVGETSMVTYVNPNVGFTGASYRAGGWTLIGDEPETTYRYLDGDYITDRDLARRVHADIDEVTLQRSFRSRYRRSHMHLKPLQIYGRRL